MRKSRENVDCKGIERIRKNQKESEINRNVERKEGRRIIDERGKGKVGWEKKEEEDRENMRKLKRERERERERVCVRTWN